VSVVTRERPGTADASARLAVAAGAAASILALVLQWPGIVLSPDGWAYWEGSISILDGDGFRYFGGQPITLWPPGFSLYLAFWQKLFGNSAGTLAFAQAAAIGVAAGLWVVAAGRLLGGRTVGLRRVALAILLALVLPIASRLVLSESLFMALFGAALVVASGSRSAPGGLGIGRELARALLFAGSLAALLLTRHVAAVFMPALVWIFGISLASRLTARSRIVLTVVGAALAFGIACGLLLDRVPVHARIELDGSAPGRVAESIGSNLRAAWRMLIPVSAGAAAATGIVCALLYGGLGALRWPSPGERVARARRRPGLGVATALAAVCGGAVFAYYGVTGPRFVLPIVLLLLLALGERAETAVRRLATAILGTLALVEVARGGYWIGYSTIEAPPGIRWGARLVRGCAVANPDCRLAPDEIAPPDFPWIDRGFAERATASPVPR
jgi:hypothetical protein